MLRRAKTSIKTAGFTLVELLTVLVIIGLMSSAVVMTLPQEKAAIISGSETLHRDLNVAAQESLLSGRVRALAISEIGYEIRTAIGDEWIVDSVSNWPEDVRVDFTRNETQVDLPTTPLPLALFEPTGGATVFRLTISNLETRIVLDSRGDGKVTWTAQP